MTRNATPHADRLAAMQAKALEKHLESYGKPGQQIGGDPIYLSTGIDADGTMHTAVVQEPISDRITLPPNPPLGTTFIVWRTDTSFPYVKIAEQHGVPYTLVLEFAYIIEMAEGFARYDRDKLKWGPVINWHRALGDAAVKAIREAVVTEHKRRLSVMGYVGYGIKGETAHTMIVDDPCGDPVTLAEQEIIRKRVNRWFTDGYPLNARTVEPNTHEVVRPPQRADESDSDYRIRVGIDRSPHADASVLLRKLDTPSEGQCFDEMMDRQQVFISDVDEALRKPIPVLDAYERVSTGGHSPAVLASPVRTAGLQDSD